jgi:hypothetical protein
VPEVVGGDLVRVSELRVGDHFTDGEGVLYRVYSRGLAGRVIGEDQRTADFLETFEPFETVQRAPAPSALAALRVLEATPRPSRWARLVDRLRR